MSVGTGKGKTILFGEHFVVYGLPSLAAGIAAETIARVKRSSKPGWTLKDKRPAVPGYKQEKAEEQSASIDNIVKYLGIDLTRQGIDILFEGNLTCASGIGASAASCVALARALNSEFRLGLNDDQINQAAYEGEKGYHGTPSGVDNTCSTFGGLIWFKTNPNAPPTFEKLRLDRPLSLVIAATGITASTKRVVDDVKAKKEHDPSWFSNIADEYAHLVEDARHALLRLDLDRTGQLMDRNHELLQDLTVSCAELDRLVAVARENGAVGAKLTGTGRGGNMIALAPDPKSASAIGKALKKAGAAELWVTNFGT
ncbi:MAG: mevalonate kinase [Candidatus Thorarchaeota archaeon]|nr:mevalonate kinase [Candidatus Thorarchaeota archaeon]